MRLNPAEDRRARAEEPPLYEHDETGRPLMTPARRAALEALEHEFAQLLAVKTAQAT